MTREELEKKVKEEIDQSYTEEDMYTLQILWTIEAIDPDHPMHESMELAYDIQEQYGAVKTGRIAHW